MAIEYEECGPDIYDILEDILDRFRSDLREAEVSVRLMWAFGGLKHQGYPALGLFKVNSYKDRAEGKRDATIFLDGDSWHRLTPERQRALVHHEAHHCEVVKDKKADGDGSVWWKTDAKGRPKLKCRKHDREIGLFTDIMAIYGPDSVEWAALDLALEDRRQRILPGMTGMLASSEAEDEDGEDGEGEDAGEAPPPDDSEAGDDDGDETEDEDADAEDDSVDPDPGSDPAHDYDNSLTAPVPTPTQATHQTTAAG